VSQEQTHLAAGVEVYLELASCDPPAANSRFSPESRKAALGHQKPSSRSFVSPIPPLVDNGQDAVEESLAFGVGPECAFVSAKQENGSAVALSKEVLSEVFAVVVFKLDAFYASGGFEVRLGQLD
jgi:hypothetical protein